MASVKNVRLFLWILTLGLLSDLIASGQRQSWSKYFPAGQGPDLGVLRREDQSNTTENTAQIQKNVKEVAVQRYEYACWKILAALPQNKKPITNIIPWKSHIFWEDDETKPKKLKEVPLIPVPTDIVFNSGMEIVKRLHQKSKPFQLRHDLCKILAFMKQEKLVHFAILFLEQIVHVNSSDSVPLFTQEAALIKQNISEITTTFNDNSTLLLKYNPESKFWICIKT